MRIAPFGYAPRFAKALRGGEQGKDCGLKAKGKPSRIAGCRIIK
jgi:hypothetical protein